MCKLAHLCVRVLTGMYVIVSVSEYRNVHVRTGFTREYMCVRALTDVHACIVKLRVYFDVCA